MGYVNAEGKLNQSCCLQKAQADIEEHLKTAEMLSLKGDTHGQKDQIINELLKVHTRFQARINEYQVLLNMTVKFFTNLNQVRWTLNLEVLLSLVCFLYSDFSVFQLFHP